MCPDCQKDHTKKNEGPLTICELEEYKEMGAKSSHTMSGASYRAFGTGNRFQFAGAR